MAMERGCERRQRRGSIPHAVPVTNNGPDGQSESKAEYGLLINYSTSWWYRLLSGSAAI
jgi:hypothetical protein